MPRGKMLKTKVKEALLEASIVQEAIKVGSLKAERKEHEKKSFLDSAREHLGKMIDRIDPLELIAVCAGTLVIRETIKSSTEMLGRLGALSQKAQEGTSGWVKTADMFNYLGIAFGQVNVFNLEQGKVAWRPQDLSDNEYILLGVSFLVSWYLFKRGGVTDSVITAGLPAILKSMGI